MSDDAKTEGTAAAAADARPTPAAAALPPWAAEMRNLFRSSSASQFLIHGNVYDLVPAPGPGGGEAGGGRRYVSLREFLTEVMFAPFDVVLHYDRGRGLRAVKGADHFGRFLQAYDAFRGTSWASGPAADGDESALDVALTHANLLPRDAKRALELIDRFLRGAIQRTEAASTEEGGGRRPAPLSVGVLIDYAHFIAPQGEAIHLAGDHSQTLIRLLDWASDPAITGAPVATVLVSENLADVNRLLVESPYSAKLTVELPGAADIATYVHDLTLDEPGFEAACEVSRDELAERLVGLSRVNVRGLVRRALAGGDKLTARYLGEVKKELIEKEAFGRIAFIESKRTLDDVAGHDEAKAWLRQDAELLKRGRLRAIPMGYLLCGRIGTGKTYLVHCWAGEVGIPVVEIKNFREKWVGATEGNLERVFTILRALGRVVVFVDEADQATGKRGGDSGDSGLSGRIYAMLAKEMSDTDNRGKIIWVFATSRPDLLEVDLKRQGRLDVHIPLFPPGDPKSRKDLFVAMARKLKIGVPSDELPDPPDDEQVGGNEMEGILVRALRLHETQTEGEQTPLPEVIRQVIADFRPSAHVERLQLMDLIAVKEATDSRFLPPRFAKLSLSEVNERITRLRLQLGE